jgi:hypothetical protein
MLELLWSSAWSTPGVARFRGLHPYTGLIQAWILYGLASWAVVQSSTRYEGNAPIAEDSTDRLKRSAAPWFDGLMV